MTQLAIKWPFSFPPHPTSASALPGKPEQTKYALKSTKKLYKILFFPDMWPRTASQLRV